jgi:hypothetical protein
MAEVQVNKADGVLVGEAGSPSSSLSGRRTVRSNSMRVMLPYITSWFRDVLVQPRRQGH